MDSRTWGRSSASSLPHTMPPSSWRERARTVTSSPRARGSRTHDTIEGGRRTRASSRRRGATRSCRPRTRSRARTLNGRWPGVTSNVGVVRGGTRSNVVAERCELQVDLRSPELATLEEAEAEVQRICADATVPDVRITIDAPRLASADGEGRRWAPTGRMPSAPPGTRVRAARCRDRRRLPTRTRRVPPARPRSTGWDRSGARPRTGRVGGPLEHRASDGPPRRDHLEAVSGMTGWPPQELHPDAYRKLVEGSPAILYIDRPDELSTNLYTSPQIVELLGYSAREWMEDAELWVRSIHPEDRERVVQEHRATKPARNRSLPSIGSSRRRAARCRSATRRCRRGRRTARSCTGAA